MDKITKDELKEAASILLSPVSFVLLAMTFILSIYTSIFSTNKIAGTSALLSCCMMLVSAIGWCTYIYQQLILVRLKQLDKKLTEWMK